MMCRHDRLRRPAWAACFIGALVLLQAPALHAAGKSKPEDLTGMSLDELLEVEVVSVSKRAEPLGRAAAAIHVISGEELRRSGARSIAEALRMVPGMDVARTSSNGYVISARGFQNTADKLQVLVDGRSVYTPLSSSVFWDVLDTDLASIERIEVIRGPGAAVWGANAVNGVVNVITRSALDSHGGEAQAAGGNEEKASANLHASSPAGDGAALRFYARAHERDTSRSSAGGDARDGQRMAQGGLRGDWTLGDAQQLSVSGDVYSARSRSPGVQSQQVEASFSGASLLGGWALETGGGNRLSTTFSFEHYARDVPEVFEETRDTYDLNLQHELHLGRHHVLTYGAGYRSSSDHTGGPPRALIFSPDSRDIDVLSAFVQDQVQLTETLALTLGSKIERNDFTGTEVQPGMRLGWAFQDDWFTWAAVSRAVRTPNRLDHDFAFYCPPPDGFPGFCGPDTVVPVGSPDFDSERLLAYEWGLRYAHGSLWSADLATFYNRYTGLRGVESDGSFFRLVNGVEGNGRGAELSLAWHPKTNLDLVGSYSFLDLNLHNRDPNSSDRSAANAEGGSPRHQAGLRLYYQPFERWTTDGFLRYVGKLEQSADPGTSGADTSVPAYTELNLRLAYRASRALEFALTGENLLHSAHAEYGAAANRAELQRSLMLGLNWSWL